MIKELYCIWVNKVDTQYNSLKHSIFPFYVIKGNNFNIIT